ncbi:DUF6152 family protein [Cellvibrio mixtus]|uniref:DUF6152 family protein n=1 Tax=Cellvibrio mixtus TaxID=39650 RepID=UPI000694E07D|nr:DUF6152 family protein [Cellvibrio mixtus]
MKFLSAKKVRSLLKPLAGVAVVSAMVFSSPTTFAHHAFSAEFDANQPIELTGVVTKLELVNPHSWLYFDVKQADGKVANWGFEFGAPFSLKQKGLTKASLPVGTQVTLKGFRAKNGLNFGYAVTATLADGRVFTTGGAPDAPANQQKSSAPKS